ncbi:hypothetical protein H6G94_32385 [Nostoc punctiforme FACHB-252]|uniref:Uncharacterized protein n=1 Tax=Nostoc punctiforme FACHB-252 TaxID=1357509 RepID=A0ABR8HLC7_NOSPU|nr:hypothetical protein [Nostoc punctiforme]MBD2615895.1 hypothetical protein [Nostoc punctiforme FACHB-252]
MPDLNKPSEMIRVPTPLIPAVRELSRLHRQGRTSELLHSLDELILALDSNSRSANSKNQTLLAICSRLDKLESQLSGESNSKETGAIHNLADLEQKIEVITNRMAQFAEAIIKIQNHLNNQPKRQKKSYNNNSYYQGQTPRIQPLTEEGLASRLGVSVETIREQRINLQPPLFVAWCKGKDRAGLGWEFNQNTGLYHPVS